MTTIEPTPAQIAAFKKAWHKADDAGDIGARTEAGLRAALNADEFSELEPGFYVTANNVTETGVNPGAVVMSKHHSGGWRIETAVSYQHEDNESRIRAWFENVGLARVELVAYQPAVTTEPAREVYALDEDDDRWEPVHATDLWHCVAPGCDYLEDLTTERLTERFGPIKFYGLD